MSDDIDWSKLNRNNKNRGRAFERKVAEVLNWTRIPYSGGMGAEWGKGDVVDGFYTQDGYWVCECKTQQKGGLRNVSVRSGWVDKMFDAAVKSSRHPLIATSLYGEAEAFVFLPENSYVFLRNMTTSGWRLPHEEEENKPSPIEMPDVIWTTKARGDGMGFVVQRSWIDAHSDWTMAMIVVQREKKGSPQLPPQEFKWFCLRLKDFRDLIHEFDVYRPPGDEDG